MQPSPLSAARQNFDVAGADNERVSALADYTRVVAPIDGVIIWRYADTGALIQAGTASDVQSLPVVKLSESNLLRLRIPVPEDAVEFIHVGAQVNVQVDAVHRTLVGKVVRFTRDISLATRTMQTEIDVENKDLSLTPGMYANTTIELERRDHVLTIPVQAVINNGNQSSVLIVDDQNHVQTRNLTLGLQGSNLVEVKNGLAEGDRVITGGQSNYQVGETVKPRLERLTGLDVMKKGGRVAMPKFALKYPFFIIMVCMVIMVVGVTAIAGMPVDLFPKIDIPVVVVATFYSGMPPQQIEADITGTFERFFTLGSNIDHIESRSLTGVSLIKIYFKPGTDANAALSNIANLAMADLRRLPPGTLPPVVLGMDASSQPVCLVTLKGQGLNETDLKDLAQFQVRNQIANVPGASVPQPYGGRYRQIMVYVDPLKLEAHNLSLMDVVRAVNQSNLILPAGDVRIGPKDYNIYANSQVPTPEITQRP